MHLRRLGEARGALAAANELLAAGTGIPLVRYHEAWAALEVHAADGGDWKQHTERAIALAMPMDPIAAMHRFANGIALSVASEIDDYSYAFELFERMQPLQDVVGEQNFVPVMHVSVRLLFVCGRLAQARQMLGRMLPFMNDGAMYAWRAASVGIPLALRTGDEHLLRSCTRSRLLEEVFASKDPVVFGPVAAGVAEHMLAQGRAGEAVALIERTLARIESAGNNFELLLLAARMGPAHTMRRAIELLQPWTQTSRSAQAVMELIRAYSHTGKERILHAQAAAALFAAFPWPLHQAQALELAGDAEGARQIYVACGAACEAERVGALAHRACAPPALSKRESEVAMLVAQGRSNRAIADELVLSERTVENHIASIFTKLGMRSRAEIAALVARENARAV